MPVVEEEQALSSVFQVRNLGREAAAFQIVSGLTQL